MSDLVSRLRDLSACKHDDLSIGDEAADEIERLQLQAEKWANLAADAEAQMVKAQRDAERYRFLRQANYTANWKLWHFNGQWLQCSAEALDVAVDKAMGA